MDVAGEGGGVLRTLAGDDVESRSPMAALAAQLSPAGVGALGVEGVAPFAASLLPLVAGEHALCAMPFALTVR